MKRAYVLLLALLLLLTGCTGKGQTNHVTVKDVCCPYEIDHTKGVAEITLQDGEKSGILWQVQVIPDDVCEVTQEDPKDEYTSRYLIVGKEAGAATLTFSALRDIIIKKAGREKYEGHKHVELFTVQTFSFRRW